MDSQSLPTNSKGPALLAAGYLLVPIAAIFVGLRLYTRCIRQKNAGLDDLFMFVAGGLSLFGMACGQVFVDWGMGQHIWNLRPEQISMSVKWLTVAELQNFGGLGILRLSVGFFLLRLIPTTSRKFVLYRRIIITAMVINVLVTIVVIGVFATQCVPLAGLWDLSIKSKCFEPEIATAVNRLFSCISAVIDFTFASLPIMVIKTLQMGRRAKVLTMLCVSFGALTGFVAIAKASVVNIATKDPTYDLSDVTICAIIEVNIGIMAACLPGLRQFIIVTTDDVKSYRSGRSKLVGDAESRGTSLTNINTTASEGSAGKSRVSLPAGGRKTSIFKHTSVTVAESARTLTTSQQEDIAAYEPWNARSQSYVVAAAHGNV